MASPNCEPLEVIRMRRATDANDKFVVGDPVVVAIDMDDNGWEGYEARIADARSWQELNNGATAFVYHLGDGLYAREEELVRQ